MHHKGHKGLKHGGHVKHDTSAKHHPHHSKAHPHHLKFGGTEQEAEGNKKVLHEAHEGTKGGGHIGGGSGPTMGRKRGGGAHHGHHGHHKAHGGEVGADKHPFSSAHKHGGKCA